MYQQILSQTLELYSKMPVVIPQKGVLCGFAREYACPDGVAFQNDNYHFPMGTTFLKYGVLGVAKLAKENAKKQGDVVKKEMLEGISITYQAIANYFDLYVQELQKQIELNPLDSVRLSRMLNNMQVLSCNAPQTFEQAIQLYYFMWKIRSLFSFTGDLGRLDVHLRPLFEKDISSGAISEQDALDVLCEFYQRLNDNNSGDTLINVSVGGLNEHGEDDGSRLSYLMLKATTIVQKTEPHINVRLNKKTRADVYDEMLNVQYLGHGQGSAYYDENVIPALIKAGIPSKLAHAYTNDGCTEITFDGYSGIDFAHIDAVACFEAAVNNGKYVARDYFQPVKYFHKDCPAIMYKPDIDYGYESGIVEQCSTYQEFYDCFLKQLKHQVEHYCKKLLDLHNARKNTVSSLFLNGTFENVLTTGNDVVRGGFELDYYQLFSGSISAVADNLCAVKKAVFDEKRYTISQLKQAIAVNYVGYEPMRQVLLNYPKFGNDIDEVDQIASQLVDKFCDYIEEFNKQNDILIVPDLLGWRFLEEAYGISATFDGRKYADPIAEHYCATPGRALNGPTAVINSIGKANLSRACGVVAVHVSLPKKLADTTQESKQILKMLVETAQKKGLLMLNIAIYDINKLRQAQIDPEHNEDVIIRVWGYSAKFVDLCKEMQDHVMSRILLIGE